MATRPTINPEGQGSQLYVPPSVRELRAQSVHRLQIGLLGLAVMLLLVGLANIIMDRARLSDLTSVASGVSETGAADKADSDPLAVIGVVPSPEASSASAPAK